MTALLEYFNSNSVEKFWISEDFGYVENFVSSGTKYIHFFHVKLFNSQAIKSYQKYCSPH